MGYIMYQISKIIFFKKHKEKINNRSIRICIKKNRTYNHIKTGYCLQLLIPEIIILLGSTKSKIAKDKNGENIPYLEISEVLLVQCHIVKKDVIVLYTIIPYGLFGQ